MDAVRLAIGLVGVLLLVSSVHVAGAAEGMSVLYRADKLLQAR